MAEASLPIRLMYAGCISYKLEDLFSSRLANGAPVHHHNYLQCSVQQINLRGDQSTCGTQRNASGHNQQLFKVRDPLVLISNRNRPKSMPKSIRRCCDLAVVIGAAR